MNSEGQAVTSDELSLVALESDVSPARATQAGMDTAGNPVTPVRSGPADEHHPSSAHSSASQRRWSVAAEPEDALVVGTVGLFRVSLCSSIKECFVAALACVRTHFVVLGLVLVSVIGMGIGTGMNPDTVCRSVIENASRVQPRTFSWRVEDLQSLSTFSVKHTYPHGSVLINATTVGAPGLNISITIWGTQEYLDSVDNDTMARSFSLINDDFVGIKHLTLFLNPPDGKRAWDSCAAAEIRVVYPSTFSNTYLTYYDITTTDGFVSVSGNKGTFPFGSLPITTNTGSISIFNALTSGPEGAPPATVLNSTTGPVSINTILSTGIIIETGGFISAHSLASGVLDTENDISIDIGGQVTVLGTGDQPVFCTGPFAADNVVVKSNEGDLYIVNSAMLIYLNASFGSEKGAVTMQQAIQSSGNLTTIYSNAGRKIMLEAVFANSMTVRTTGEIYMLLVYSGLNYPTEYFTNLKKRLTYAAPYLGVIGGSSSVKVLSAGTNPQYKGRGKNKQTIEVNSTSGDIKFELNGGGYKGVYSVATTGAITIELENGTLGSPTGSILNDDSQFNGTFQLNSQSGDIDLTFLPSAV